MWYVFVSGDRVAVEPGVHVINDLTVKVVTIIFAQMLSLDQLHLLMVVWHIFFIHPTDSVSSTLLYINSHGP